ncbi:MAG: hypothetical protein SV375_12525 [Thermodesulfobacteriota bacterium]|nr:hypothetical protein [Thermodesulfobacteriota bacterium]
MMRNKDLKNPIEERLLKMFQQGVEVEVGFMWTCGGVLFKEKGIIISLEDKYVVLKDIFGNKNTIHIDNISEVKEVE